MDVYPMHRFVFKDDLKGLKSCVEGIAEPDLKDQLNARDLRGRTPLMLAVTMGHINCAKYLLEMGSNPNVEDETGFNVLQESLGIGDEELIGDILQRRDFHRYCSRADGIPAALLRVRDTKDFFVEMKWEFTSWIPMISSFLPSDTYKIYKQGSKVRIDTTIIGFENNSWQRGNKSYVFDCKVEGSTFLEMDHDNKTVHLETMKSTNPMSEEALGMLRPPEHVLQARIKSPTTTTYINTDSISFQRARTGVYPFRSDKTEEVNGYDCRVFYAAPIEVITRSRSEHLTVEDKQDLKEQSNTLLKSTPFFNSILGSESSEGIPCNSTVPVADSAASRNPHKVTISDYFDPSISLKEKDIGVKREVTTRVQKFKATLWMGEDYPLSLPEQILPVVDLMALSSGHFAKYRDFINLCLPSGFPIRIEIPLFHVMNAKVTFGNIFSMDKAVDKVSYIPAEDPADVACVIDESVFEPPPGYRIIGDISDNDWAMGDRERGMDEDERMLRVINSLCQDQRQLDLQEVLKHDRQMTDEFAMAQAVQASLEEMARIRRSQHDGVEEGEGSGEGGVMGIDPNALSLRPQVGNLNMDSDLALAIRLSQQEQDSFDSRIREEEEMLNRVLALSMQEK